MASSALVIQPKRGPHDPVVLPACHSQATPSADESEALGRTLLESDRRYFELAAEIEDLGFAELAYMPGLADVASGFVVHRFRDERLSADIAPRLAATARRCHRLGAHAGRFYLDHPTPDVESALVRMGAQQRWEIGLVATAGGTPLRPDLALTPIRGDADWLDKQDLHEGDDSPDGHPTAPQRWTLLERRKCQTGAMRPFLVRARGRAVAALSVIVCGALWRVKNVYVRPSLRRRGIASDAVRLVGRLAAEEGATSIGVFVVADAAGAAVYPKLGFREVVRQSEWMTPPFDDQAAAVPSATTDRA